jgi:hypothetical protein
MNIMSDGKADGIALMYLKDGIAYPVGLTKEQVEMLDMTISLSIGGKLLVITDEPIGKMCNITEGK